MGQTNGEGQRHDQEPQHARDKSASRGEVVLYKGPEGTIELDVRLQGESLWLSLNQLVELQGRDKSVVSRHLGKVFRAGELQRKAVVAKYATTAADGKTYQVEYYNLDAIISVGYRVNSKQGTQFRIWATGVLRDHLLMGYTVHQSRLSDLNQAVKLIAATASRRDLSGAEAKSLLEVAEPVEFPVQFLQPYAPSPVLSVHGTYKRSRAGA